MASLEDSAVLASSSSGKREKRPAVFRLRVALSGTPVRDHKLDQDLVTMGRDPTCTVHLDNSQVSRHHCEIRRESDVFAIFDRKSVNGIFVNGNRVEESALLANGDRIAVGPFEMIFEATTTTVVEAAPVVEGATNLRISRLRSTSKVSLRTPERARGYIVKPEVPGEAGRIFISEAYQIGRAPGCDLTLEAPAPYKAALIVRGFVEYRIFKTSDAVEIKVNGSAVASYQVLQDGDAIEIGGRRLLFSLSGARSASGRLLRSDEEL
jgi:pSer/pThr/pTyr-binding forkhead associated (FHA) protein